MDFVEIEPFNGTFEIFVWEIKGNILF